MVQVDKWCGEWPEMYFNVRLPCFWVQSLIFSLWVTAVILQHPNWLLIDVHLCANSPYGLDVLIDFWQDSHLLIMLLVSSSLDSIIPGKLKYFCWHQNKIVFCLNWSDYLDLEPTRVSMASTCGSQTMQCLQWVMLTLSHCKMWLLIRSWKVEEMAANGGFLIWKSKIRSMQYNNQPITKSGDTHKFGCRVYNELGLKSSLLNHFLWRSCKIKNLLSKQIKYSPNMI